MFCNCWFHSVLFSIFTKLLLWRRLAK